MHKILQAKFGLHRPVYGFHRRFMEEVNSEITKFVDDADLFKVGSKAVCEKVQESHDTDSWRNKWQQKNQSR